MTTALKFNHYGSESPYKFKDEHLIEMAAEVGLISRNVVIEGTDAESWGCRILVPGYTAFDEAGNNFHVQGRINLNAVLVKNCGQKNTLTGALDTRVNKRDLTSKNIV